MALGTVCAVWLTPAVGLLVSSFRPARDVSASGWWTTPAHPALTLDNYQQVLAGGLGQSVLNSVLITVPATVIPILIAVYAAYAFAWMEFPGRGLVFAMVVALLIVPLQTTFIPVLRLLTALGLTGTFGAVWLAHTGYGLPLAVFLLRNFIGALPRDLIDSAAIDGASAVETFFRLVLPLSLPALASLAIFQFLWVWNDLLVALLYLGGRPGVAPMTVTVSNLVNADQVLDGHLRLRPGVRGDPVKLGGHVRVAVVDRGGRHAGDEDQLAGVDLDRGGVRHVVPGVILGEMNRLHAPAH